jgi:hypothetical protein
MDPKPGLHSATIISVLVTSECTAGSLLAACGVGVVITVKSAHRNRNQRVSQPAAVAICKMEWLHLVNYRGCNHEKQELQHRRNLWMTTLGSAGRMFFSKRTTPDQSFAAALCSSDQQHPQQPSQQKKQESSGKNMHQDTNQISGQANANQFGFRIDHSMTLQCMRLADHITLNFNNNMPTAAVLFGY